MVIPPLEVCINASVRSVERIASPVHADRIVSLALGIGADALGELYWLPDELPDALR
jgi:hypothetical protein